LLGRRDVRLHALPFPEQRDHRLQAGVLPRQVAEPRLVGDHPGVGEQRGDLLETLPRTLELGDDGGLHRPSRPRPSSPNSSRVASTSASSDSSPARRRRTVGWCSSFLSSAPATYSMTDSGSAPLPKRRLACASTSWRSASPWSRSAAITGVTERLRSTSR